MSIYLQQTNYSKIIAMKKLFLLITSLLAFALGEVGADEPSTKTSIFIQTLPNVMTECDFRESTKEGVPFHFHQENCYDYIHGIKHLRKLVLAYFKGKQVDESTIISYERRNSGHARVQLAVMRYVIPTNVPIGQMFGGDGYVTREGVVTTYSWGRVFNKYVEFNPIIARQNLDVMGAGNYAKKTSTVQYIDSIMYDTNSFLVSTGWRIVNLYDDCVSNPKTCEPTLAHYPQLDDSLGSSWCGSKAKEMCVLGPWSFAATGSNGYSLGGLAEGNSISTPYAGSVIWLLSSALRYLYNWNEGITQKQAMMMAGAIVKSCAIDLGDSGPDNRTGLGLLHVGCMEDGDGLVKDPMKLINSEYMFLDRYTYPTIRTTTQTIVAVRSRTTTETISVETTTTNSVIDENGVETRTLLTTTVLEIRTTITTSTTIIPPNGVETTEEEQRTHVTDKTVTSNKAEIICPERFTRQERCQHCFVCIRAKVFLEGSLR